MFERLKKTDKVLFWIVMVAAVLWLLIGIIGSFTGGIGILLIGVFFAAILFFGYYIAGLFYFIAVDKGYSSKVYLHLCFWITIVGFLLVIAMPDRGGNPQYANDELPDL